MDDSVGIRAWGMTVSISFQHFPHLVGKREEESAVLHIKDGAWLGKGGFLPDHTSKTTLKPIGNSAPWPRKAANSDFVFLLSFAIHYSTTRNLVQIYLE